MSNTAQCGCLFERGHKFEDDSNCEACDFDRTPCLFPDAVSIIEALMRSYHRDPKNRAAQRAEKKAVRLNAKAFLDRIKEKK